MLALYLTTLIVGGVFVGLSMFSGVDKDGGASADKDFAGDHDVDHALGHDHDHDFDGDFDADLDADLDAGTEIATVDHASLADASHGGPPKQRGQP